MPVVVSDTSPIRALAHVGHLPVLEALFGEALITPSVVDELERPAARFAPVHVASLPFVRVRAPIDRTKVDELTATLGTGEAEALALALEIHADAVLIDESAGRAVARGLGLVPIGVLGILLRAKQRGLVQTLAPLLDTLIWLDQSRVALGFRLDYMGPLPRR